MEYKPIRRRGAKSSVDAIRLPAIQSRLAMKITLEPGKHPLPVLYPLLRPLVWSLLRAGMTLLGGFQVTGREHVPRRGGVLLICNHLSVCDPPYAALASPRPVSFLAREYLFRIPVLGPFIAVMRAYPVDPARGQMRSIRHAVKVLRAGQPLVMFPEGRCSLDGRLQPFLSGAALIAWMARVPVVPLALDGTQRLVPVGRLFPRPAPTITGRFGPPVDLTGLGALPRPKWIREATLRMQQAIARLLETPSSSETAVRSTRIPT